jgi:recombinational DNA repair protein RecR
MRKMIFAFIGKKKDLQAQLAAAVACETRKNNVIYLQKCELCGRLTRGDFCKKCEPLFKRWTRKVALEMQAPRATEKNPTDPIIV